jgi:glycosyltransferase involved in cell wall biosynthesis
LIERKSQVKNGSKREFRTRLEKMSDKHTVLVLTSSTSPKNGSGRYSSNIIRRMAEDYQVIVYSGKADDADESHIEHPNVKINRLLPSRWALARVAMMRVSATLIKMAYPRPFFIQSLDDFPYCHLGETLRRKWKCPHFISSLGTYSVKPFNDLKQGRQLKNCFDNAKTIFPISSYTKEQLLSKISVGNLEVIPIATDNHYFSRNPQFEKTSENFNILSVGQIKRRKGFDLILKSLPAIIEKHPHVRCRFVGDYDENNEYVVDLKDFVTENNLQDHVTFTSEISEPELLREFHEASVFAMAPRNSGDAFEGFGLVFLEASAMGLPLISTSPSGVDEIIKDGYNGFKIKAEDHEAVTDKIIQLIEDPELLKTMGENALEHSKTFSWDKTYQSMKVHYDKLKIN